MVDRMKAARRIVNRLARLSWMSRWIMLAWVFRPNPSRRGSWPRRSPRVSARTLVSTRALRANIEIDLPVGVGPLARHADHVGAHHVDQVGKRAGEPAEVVRIEERGLVPVPAVVQVDQLVEQRRD